MQTLFAYLGGVLVVFILAIFLSDIVLVLIFAQDPSRGLGNLAQRLLNWLVLAIWTLPVALATATGSLINHIQTYWKLYLLSVVVLLLASGWMAKQDDVMQKYDAYETRVVYPFNNDVLLPILNAFRLMYDGIICWFNLAAGIGRYVRWSMLVVANDCIDYNKNATIEAAGKIPLLPVDAINKFILSGFTSNLDLAPTMNAIADTLSSFGSMIHCQCEAIFPVIPMLLDEDYGMLQSSHSCN